MNNLTQTDMDHQRPANIESLCRWPMSKQDCFIYSSIVEVVNIIGVIINAFIAGVNIIDLTKGRTLKPVDKVLISLGLCRFVLQALVILETAKYFIWFADAAIQFISVPWLVVQKTMDYCNLWFSAWLCFLYCVKIVDSKHHFFQLLKLKIHHLVLPAILGSICISVVSASVLAWHFNEKIIKPPSDNSSLRWNFQIHFPPLIFGHFLPFLIAAISSLLLLQTLLAHVCRIKKKSGDLSTLRLEGHIATIRTVLLFLLISAFKLSSIIVKTTAPIDSIFFPLSFIISYTFPTLHSVALCFGNMKLKHALGTIMSRLKQCKIFPQTSNRNS